MSEEKIHPLVERLTVGLFPFGQENCGIATKIITAWLEERVREYEREYPSGEGLHLRSILGITPSTQSDIPPPKRKVLKAQALIKDALGQVSVTDALYTEQEAKEKFGTSLIEWPVGVQREVEVEG